MRRDISIVVATALALVGAIAAVPRPSASASPREEHAAPTLTTEEETALGWLASTPLAARLGGTLRTDGAHASDSAVVQRVRRLGDRLAMTATAKGTPWRFTFEVVEDSSLTALALPGGVVLVGRRTATMLDGDDEMLAAVLAHQMAHVLARHAMRSLATDPAARALLTTLDSPTLDVARASDAALAIVQRARMDDDAEPEADALAARLLAEAGMNAAAAIRVLHMPAPAPFHGVPGDVEVRGQRLASLVGQ